MSDIMEFDTQEANTESTDTEKYLIFTLFDKYYSFQSHYISEIAILDSIYPLPLMPPYIPGIINRYSLPYAVIDTALLLYNTPGKQKKVLVVKEDIDRLAFMIDDVTGITDIPKDSLSSIERSQDSNDTAEAVCASFTWKDSNVFVLDIHKILERVTGDIS